MIREQDKIVNIPAELTSAAEGHKVTAAEDIFDYQESEYQNVINTRFKNQHQVIINTIERIEEERPIPLTEVDIDLICQRY